MSAVDSFKDAQSTQHEAQNRDEDDFQAFLNSICESTSSGKGLHRKTKWLALSQARVSKQKLSHRILAATED